MTITEDTKKNVAGIAREHGIALFVLFGSQASGYTHDKSDVDIGFTSHEYLAYGTRYEISTKLARVFKNPDIELVDLTAVSPELKKQVADDGMLLYEERPTLFELFKISAYRLYLETKPLRRYRDEYLKRFLQKYA